jgi:aminoglycoside 6'-N-acetyltransferase
VDTNNPWPAPDVSFRPLTREDLPQLGKWLAEPQVRHWWQHDPTPEAVTADFGPGIDGSDPTRFYVVLEGTRAIGLIQSYRIGDHPEWLMALRVVNASHDAVGIDYLIGEVEAMGRGLGTAMIRRFVPEIVVAVQQDNPRSWRALEKAGFRRIWSGVLESDDPSDRGPNHVYRLKRFDDDFPKRGA